MSRRVKGITITLGADKTGLDRALKEIESVSRNLNKELRDTNNLLRFSPDNTELVTQKQKLLGEQIKATREKLDQLREAEAQVQEQFEKGEIAEDQYRAFKREVIETESQLRHYEKALRDISDGHIIFGKKLQEAGEKMQAVGDKMATVGKNLTLKVTAPILAIGTAGVTAAIDFESGMAGVRKTTNLTGEELDKMGQALRDMSKEIPVSVVELTALAETAGQLGIDKDHIVEFTRVIADLSVATNIIGQEGATDLARFANIMGMSQKDFDRAGSAIVELGNNSATTEKEILEMAKRLAGAARQANMSEADVLGIATALSALGIEAQAGGTAFSRVINRIQLAIDTGSDDLYGFAEVAGMTAGEFANAWRDDAAGALADFVVGLSDTTKHGKSTNEMLAELEINEIRVSDALRRTSGANELFKDSLKMSNDAWEDNNALQEEAAIRYETTESKLKIAKNEMNDAAIDLGQKLIPTVMSLIEFITDLVTGFQKLAPETQDTIIKMGLFAAALGPVISVAGKVTSGIGKITGGIGKLYEATGKGEGIIGSFASKIGGVGPLALAGAATAAAIALGLTIAEMWAVDPAVKEARKAVDEFVESAGSATSELMGQTDLIEKYKTELYELVEAEDKTATQKARIEDLVKRLNALVPDLVLEYEKETDQLNKTKTAIDGVIEVHKLRLVEAAKGKIIAEWEETYGDILMDVARKQHDLNIVTEQSQKLEDALARARLTGLSDFDIRMAQSSKAVQEHNNWHKVLTDEQTKAVAGVVQAYDEAKGSVELLTEQSTDGWSTATHAVDTMAEQTRKLTDDTNALNDEIDKGSAVYESTMEYMEAYIGSLLGIEIQSKETTEQIEDDEARKTAAIEQAAKDQAQAQKNLEDAAEKHKNAMNGFTKERFDYEKGTTDEFIKMWEAEALAFQNYHGNLQTIASRVGPDVAAELAKLGPEAAPLIAQFAEASDEELKKLVLAFETRTRLAAEQAKLELGVLGGTGENAGKALMDGVRRGIVDNQHTVIDASRTTANVIKRALESGLSISSPSKVGIEIGRNFAESLGLGMGRGEGEVDRSAAGLAKTMADAMRLPDLPALKGGNVIDGRSAFAGLERSGMTTVNGGDIIIQHMSVRDDNDIRKIAVELHNLQHGQKRGRGMA